MDGNKKENTEEKVKIYDKDMYISQEKLKMVALIILIFIVGFIAGYVSGSLTNTNETNIKQESSNMQDSNNTLE